MKTSAIFIGKGEKDLFFDPRWANRHALIAGATGTGKTVTLQVLVEGFSRIGVPVFLPDVKGDLEGLGAAGATKEPFQKRAKELNLSDYRGEAFSVVFWSSLGEPGHVLRATVSDIGPLLFSRLLELTEAQESILYSVFQAADEHELLLHDLKDLRAVLEYFKNHPQSKLPASSINALLRRLSLLEEQKAEAFLGEPLLNVSDLLKTDSSGRGVIHILKADQLLLRPKLYATVLLWLLAELFENLPEAGDLEKPKLVLCFDEAHLLFEDTSKALIQKVEQAARLIRSKGVGLFFITQSPSDLPSDILGQLGNRFQHALRAYTPKDRKALRAAAQAFRENPKIDVEKTLPELGVGEALVSLIDEKGAPTPVERVKIAPPRAQVGALSPAERHHLLQASPLAGKYEKPIEALSAFEKLQKQSLPPPEPPSTRRRTYNPAADLAKTAARTATRALTYQIVRGLFGTFLGGRRRRGWF